MQPLNALSLAPAVNEWLASSQHPHILHVFDRACNLINEHREVLSIVTSQIGNGPFNLVVEDDVLFSECLHIASPILIRESQLALGDLTINITGASLWSPRPDWERLQGKRETIIEQVSKLPNTDYLHQIPQFSNSLVSSLAIPDFPSSLTITKQLAGLGQGLTPAGDDFLLGAILAVWIIHPFGIASALATEIANTTAPLTTSLSAAWLKSAGKGEAGILWHEFFDTLLEADIAQIQTAMDKILAVGETSGADALAGFISTLISYAERETKLCRS